MHFSMLMNFISTELPSPGLSSDDSKILFLFHKDRTKVINLELCDKSQKVSLGGYECQ